MESKERIDEIVREEMKSLYEYVENKGQLDKSLMRSHERGLRHGLELAEKKYHAKYEKE